MEALTRLVTDSLVRHGFDRPVDPRRLQWSRWFRCDSPHSLLVVPSKPGIFAIAEEIVHMPEPSTSFRGREGQLREGQVREGHDFSRADSEAVSSPALAAEGPSTSATLQRCDPSPQSDTASAQPKRMLAVLQFSEDDDMAFTLDRMFTVINPMRARLSSGSCFLRYVVIEDQSQRRSICSALNQWMLSSAEKASGIPSAFSSSLELNLADSPSTNIAHRAPAHPVTDAGANKNLHCSQPLPSGF
jgi:hypothetical protein